MNRIDVYKMLEEEGLLCERLKMKQEYKNKAVKNTSNKTIRGRRRKNRKRG